MFLFFEGIANITQALDAKGMLDDTLIVFTTVCFAESPRLDHQDNGGQNCYGGNNWPLRGNKATVWEGGVRGNGFVSGWGVPEALKNTTYSGLMHVTDWLPTLARIANVSITDVGPHATQQSADGANGHQRH